MKTAIQDDEDLCECKVFDAKTRGTITLGPMRPYFEADHVEDYLTAYGSNDFERDYYE